MVSPKFIPPVEYNSPRWIVILAKILLVLIILFLLPELVRAYPNNI